MNVYCVKCKQELEIMKDLGSELHVASHECLKIRRTTKTLKQRKPRPDKYDPRDIAILGGDPSL